MNQSLLFSTAVFLAFSAISVLIARRAKTTCYYKEEWNNGGSKTGLQQVCRWV